MSTGKDEIRRELVKLRRNGQDTANGKRKESRKGWQHRRRESWAVADGFEGGGGGMNCSKCDDNGGNQGIEASHVDLAWARFTAKSVSPRPDDRISSLFCSQFTSLSGSLMHSCIRDTCMRKAGRRAWVRTSTSQHLHLHLPGAT